MATAFTPNSRTKERDRAGRRLSFTTQQWVPYRLDRVFGFFADPANLPRLMPRWQDARIDSQEIEAPDSPTDGGFPFAAGRGSRILLSFRPLPFSPVRLRWLAQIDDYAANHHFCDLQVIGPFAYWRHCHLVSAEARAGVDGTTVTDTVDYAWPGGPLGGAVDILGGRWQMRQIFRYRQQQLPRLLGG